MLVLILFILMVFLILNEEKFTKQDIADYFNISRKTLFKWIKYLNLKMDLKTWNSIRKVKFSDTLLLINELDGSPNGISMTKGELSQACGTTYTALRGSSELLFQNMKISEKAYTSIDIFPPKLSQKIINHISD